VLRHLVKQCGSDAVLIELKLSNGDCRLERVLQVRFIRIFNLTCLSGKFVSILDEGKRITGEIQLRSIY